MTKDTSKKDLEKTADYKFSEKEIDNILESIKNPYKNLSPKNIVNEFPENNPTETMTEEERKKINALVDKFANKNTLNLDKPKNNTIETMTEEERKAINALVDKFANKNTVDPDKEKGLKTLINHYAQKYEDNNEQVNIVNKSKEM